MVGLYTLFIRLPIPLPPSMRALTFLNSQIFSNIIIIYINIIHYKLCYEVLYYNLLNEILRISSFRVFSKIIPKASFRKLSQLQLKLVIMGWILLSLFNRSRFTSFNGIHGESPANETPEAIDSLTNDWKIPGWINIELW